MEKMVWWGSRAHGLLTERISELDIIIWTLLFFYAVLMLHAVGRSDDTCSWIHTQSSAWALLHNAVYWGTCMFSCISCSLVPCQACRQFLIGMVALLSWKTNKWAVVPCFHFVFASAHGWTVVLASRVNDWRPFPCAIKFMWERESVCVCMWVHLCVCDSVSVFTWLCVCVSECVCVCVHVCVCVCVCVGFSQVYLYGDSLGLTV